jgi:hypothetical protein
MKMPGIVTPFGIHIFHGHTCVARIQLSPRIKLLKEHGREILIDPQTEATLLAAAKQPLRDVIVIVQDTGMRPQDVFRLRWEHVNWFKQAIFIPYGKTKNSRRYVPLSDRIKRALKARGAGAAGWVFPSRHSQSGHITNVAKQGIAARQAAGLDESVKLYCCLAHVRDGCIGTHGQFGGAYENARARGCANSEALPATGPRPALCCKLRLRVSLLVLADTIGSFQEVLSPVSPLLACCTAERIKPLRIFH